MKIIVDEMPKQERQCLFCEEEYDYGGYFCKFGKDVCNVDMCDWLKSITDYCTEEFVSPYISKRNFITKAR